MVQKNVSDDSVSVASLLKRGSSVFLPSCLRFSSPLCQQHLITSSGSSSSSSILGDAVVDCDNDAEDKEEDSDDDEGKSDRKAWIAKRWRERGVPLWVQLEDVFEADRQAKDVSLEVCQGGP